MRYIDSPLTYLLTYIGSHVRYKSTNVSEMIRNRDKQTVLMSNYWEIVSRLSITITSDLECPS